MKTLLAVILALFCLPAVAQCVVDGTPHPSCTVTTTGTVLPVVCYAPNIIVNGVCIAVPPVDDTCAGSTNERWPMLTASLWPSSPANISGGTEGWSFAFTADAVTFPTGLIGFVSDEDPRQIAKEMVVSACPHSFIPVNSQVACRDSGKVNTAITMRFLPPAGDCNLQAGGRYYVNIRAPADTRAQIGGRVRSTCWFCP
jgi:hypothetical protein